MKHINEFKTHKQPEGLAKALDAFADSLKRSGDFHMYWDIVKDFPEYTMDSAGETKFDYAKVNLSNHAIVPKRVPDTWRLRMMLELWRDLHNDMGYKTHLSYSRWLESGTFDVYRGEPGDKPKQGIAANGYGDFSLDRDMSVRFTQEDWAVGAFHDDKQRNGFLYTATVSPADVWMYNNEGDEHEVLLKGPVAFSSAERVVNGKITGK